MAPIEITSDAELDTAAQAAEPMTFAQTEDED